MIAQYRACNTVQYSTVQYITEPAITALLQLDDNMFFKVTSINGSGVTFQMIVLMFTAIL